MALVMATPASSRSQPVAAVDIALPSDGVSIRAVHSAAAASLRSLAAVELQLLMHCCDQRTLLSLARCSRFTLQAASNDFAWRCLSPLELTFIHPLAQDADIIGARQQLHCCLRPPLPPSPLLPLPLAERVSTSLLRFCDVAIKWSHDGGGDRAFSPVTDVELDALAAIPRLRALDLLNRMYVERAHIGSLARRAALRGLTAIACHGVQLDESSVRALAECCPRLSTVAISSLNRIDQQLHLLPALTDLTVEMRHSGGLTMVSVARCTGLRRLAVWADPLGGCTSREVHTALLSPNLRALEYLAVSRIDTLHADGRRELPAQLDWAVAFVNLPALQSLRVDYLRGMDELLTAISAGCAQLHSLQISSDVGFDVPIGVGVTLPSAAVLSTLLARRPSLRSVALLLPTRDGFMSARRSDEHTRRRIWLRAHGDLSVLAALHHPRLSVRFSVELSVAQPE